MYHLQAGARLLSVLFAYGILSRAANTPFDPPLQTFHQKIDHSSNGSGTFLQRYQLKTADFKPGGPILFHQSEENDLADVSLHVFSDYAPKVGAIVAALEHRYFGESYPHGLNSSSDIATNLKSMS